MKEFKYKINGTPYRVVVTKSDSDSVELEVNGTPYTVEMVPSKMKSLSGIKRPPSTAAAPPAPPTPQSTTTPLVTRPSAPRWKKIHSNHLCRELFWIYVAKWEIA